MLSRAVGCSVLVLVVGATVAAEPRLGHRRTVWENPQSSLHKRAAMEFGAAYRQFIAAYKTEREVVGAFVDQARKRGS